jgi:hypothetical protein
MTESAATTAVREGSSVRRLAALAPGMRSAGRTA